jgi:hypothetical protein
MFLFKIALCCGLKKKLKEVWVLEFKFVFSKNHGSGLYVAKNIYKIFNNCVWKCGCGCFSKYLLLGNTSKYFF